MQDNLNLKKEISFESFQKQILEDYKTIVLSREASLLGRREVLNGKAKFGIVGSDRRRYLIQSHSLLHTIAVDAYFSHTVTYFHVELWGCIAPYTTSNAPFSIEIPAQNRIN